MCLHDRQGTNWQTLANHLPTFVLKPPSFLCRLFLNRVQTDAAKKANPGLKINTQVLSDPAAKSTIDIAYRK